MVNLDLSGEFTGRYLVCGKPGKGPEMLKEIKSLTGLNLANAADLSSERSLLASMDTGDGLYLDKLGIAIINAPSETILQNLSAMSASVTENGDSESTAPIIEPERVCRVIDTNFKDYFAGYRDAVNNLVEKYNGTETPGQPTDGNGVDAEAIGNTWGLVKTKVVVKFPFKQTYTGFGIKVAVLDTGMDLNHPDFAGRTIVSQSFVPGQSVQDLHSHGTHCIGTACGPLNPTDPTKERYGVAHKATIFAGKVLNNSGSGADGWILAGINWSITNHCQVISMSLGAPVSTAGFSAVYESAAQTALNAGCLIVAAAGNNNGSPVSHPANCPSIMAVGAVDTNLVKAGFSNITFFPPHGKVDIAAPGVNTFSSVPMPTKYGVKSGTSMATPHVAGIAALWAQSNATLRGTALWVKLTTKALALMQPVAHVGAGLVQAPYKSILVSPVKPPIVLPKSKLPNPKQKPISLRKKVKAR